MARSQIVSASLTNDEKISKGDHGERLLNAWLNEQGMSYVYVNQDRKYFANLFQGEVKRPDFLVLLEAIGILAVDAKNCQTSDWGNHTLSHDELRKAANFERLFRIPVWYAFRYETEAGDVWRWISLLKALEVGKDRGDFRAIEIEDFAEVSSNADFGKLYAQRLPALKKHKSILPSHKARG